VAVIDTQNTEQTVAIEGMSGLTNIKASMPVSAGFALISVILNGYVVCEVRRDKELEEVLGVHYFVYNSQRWVQR